jgi:hypothetical protein
MANEITVTVKLSAVKGFLNYRDEPGVQSITMNGSTGSGGVHTVFTSHGALAIGSVGTAGWAFFRNTDATNFVEIGRDNAGTFIGFVKLKAGESCILRLTTNAPYARANTASVNLQYYILAD